MATSNPGAKRVIVDSDREKMVMFPDGRDALITLSMIPELLEEFFDLEEGSIPKPHVYVWWDRSLNNSEIRLPMPTPKQRIGNSYVWEQQQIVHWYGAWKGLDVPECSEAGDIINRNGNMRRSPLRSVYGT